jgi:predicted metal-dependent HD superfamily phosphohydrolase
VLRHVDDLADLARDVTAVRLAAWFHDAVYDGAPDAEERSAQLAERELAGVGLDAALRGEVVRLVRLTATHDVADGDADGAVLADADLAVLAADPERYAAYASGVRREYAHVGDAEFAAGRSAVLRRLLARPSLYRTPYAQAHWEARARANVETELVLLSVEAGADRPPAAE